MLGIVPAIAQQRSRPCFHPTKPLSLPSLDVFFSFILHNNAWYFPCPLPTALSSMLPSDQGIIHAAACQLFHSHRPTKLTIIHDVSRQSFHPCCHPTTLGIIHSNACLLFHSSSPTTLGIIYAVSQQCSHPCWHPTKVLSMLPLDGSSIHVT